MQRKVIKSIFLFLFGSLNSTYGDEIRPPKNFPSFLNFGEIKACAIVGGVGFPRSGPFELDDGSWYEIRGKVMAVKAQRMEKLEVIRKEIPKPDGYLRRPWAGGNLVKFCFYTKGRDGLIPSFICSVQTSTPRVLQFYKVSVVKESFLGVSLKKDFCEVSNVSLSNHILALSIDLILESNK